MCTCSIIYNYSYSISCLFSSSFFLSFSVCSSLKRRKCCSARFVSWLYHTSLGFLFLCILFCDQLAWDQQIFGSSAEQGHTATNKFVFNLRQSSKLCSCSCGTDDVKFVNFMFYRIKAELFTNSLFQR